MSAEPIVVPYGELSVEALRGVIESFVLREGTDYGTYQYSLDEKVEQILGQLRRGEAEILFDADSESVTIAAIPATSR